VRRAGAAAAVEEQIASTSAAVPDKLSAVGMKRFSDYVLQLERSAAALDGSNIRHAAALDGEPSRELRRVISLAQRRRNGAFFTSSILARKAVSGVPAGRGRVFFDPACGAGDLLLAAARLLPVRASLNETLNLWGQCLTGCDIHPEFVRATKARLVLLAKQMGVPSNGQRADLRKVFPFIEVANALTVRQQYASANWILLNPPYVAMEAPETCEWCRGKVSSAALFVEQAILRCGPRARITAILPDVLRTGTRYSKWRRIVSAQTRKVSLRPWGLFDAAADVDVFLLTITKQVGGSSRFSWVPTTPKSRKKLGDLFDVHVGPVVPFRLTGRGQATAFIHAKALPRWAQIDQIDETCHFTGTLYQPPFVVVRRTSRPGDAQRAVATLVTAPGQVAVENHLIICMPKSGLIRDCRELLKRLQHPQTSRFLDRRIRCRHITVSAMREIPWPVAS